MEGNVEEVQQDQASLEPWLFGNGLQARIVSVFWDFTTPPVKGQLGWTASAS